MSNNIKDKALSGIAWTSLERLVQQIVQFVIGILIARVLAPEDYGVIGMTAIFFAVAQTLIDSGFGSALIQKQNRTETDYSTCFYFNALLGIVLYVFLYFSAPSIAAFYHTPILCDVMRMLGLTLIVNSLMIAQMAKLTAEMRFRVMSVITILTQVLTGVIGLLMAYSGYGVWALVCQQVGGTVCQLLLLECYMRWVPSPVFSMSSFRHMFSFGSKILCSGMINTIYDNLYTLVIGRTFSAQQVGFYNRGNQFATLPSNLLLSVVMKVAYPLMAAVQEDRERLRTAYIRFLSLPLCILYPVLSGMIALAKPMVLVLLGEKWLPAVPLLQILCLGAFFDPLTHINLNILYVKGRTDLVLKLELIKKPIAFLLLFVSLPFGIYWLCLSRSVYGLIAYCFNCHYTASFIDYGFWKQVGSNSSVVVRSAVMGAVCYGCTLIAISPLAQLIVAVIVGVVLYFLLAIITKDDTLSVLISIIKEKRHGKND